MAWNGSEVMPPNIKRIEGWGKYTGGWQSMQ